ncbi:MAG: YihY/virulence factor BrkB family protein [Leucobacter sp.]
MTKPRDHSPTTGGEDRGASRVSELVAPVKRRWVWAQGLRPWRAWSRFVDVGGSVLSAGMSYQALFAVFAGLYVGFGVSAIWLRHRPELVSQIVDQINMFVPGLLGTNGAVSLNQLLAARALDWTSLVAGVSLLWLAITWFTGTRRAIRIIFGLEVKQYKNAVLLKLRDFALAIGFFLAIVVSAALTLVSSNLLDSVVAWLDWDPNNWLVSGLGSTIRYLAMYIFDVLVLIAIHYWLAEVRVQKWRLWGGCALGGLGLFGLKVLGTALLGGASSNPLLASFAVLIGLLIWFNLICRMLLLTASWIACGVDHSLGRPEEDTL